MAPRTSPTSSTARAPKAPKASKAPTAPTAPKTRKASKIDLVVNRKRRTFNGAPFRRLIDVLREDFGLTGTKEGCGEGECGACTVLVNGEPVNSCLIPVCQVEGQSIRTVESLGRPDALNTLQQQFLHGGGAQCGICTPGILMTATAWIERGGSADPDAIRRVLAGNLCRCTGYQHIVDAVSSAVRERQGNPSPQPGPPTRGVGALGWRPSPRKRGEGVRIPSPLQGERARVRGLRPKGRRG